MTIDLANDVQKFIEEQVRAGVSDDPAKLVNDVIRSLREQQEKPFAITPELESWLLEAADQNTTPLSISRMIRGVTTAANIPNNFVGHEYPKT
jgi:hypothetical protein